jgi:prepilin-type N-terminal cleavage/methylation domain-containing protein/prepilin-type processing-associated H-X9-DG protein
MPDQRKSPGFTLIEVLVVIAIITLLAAILFPVFARARENARRASCMSNLKQIAMGVMQYTQDYDEGYPPTNYQSPTPPETGYWTNSGTGKGIFWQQIIYPYVKNEQVYACPSVSRYRTGNGRLLSGHYGANRLIVTPDGTPPLKLSAIDSPASVYLIMDSGTYVVNWNSVTAPSGSFNYVPGMGQFVAHTFSNSDTQDDFMNGRHFQGVNMVYADGHLKWLRSEVLYNQASQADHGAWDPANS